MLYEHLELLEKGLEEEYIKSQKHPVFDLTIYNYTPKTQYEKYWNPATLECRGLVLNSFGEVVARPFSKFFNHTEQYSIENRPKLPKVVYEKLDGSLIIVFIYKGSLIISSRGSFTSNQVIWAEELIRDSKFFRGDLSFMKGKTMMFELIHPKNRIVVDYGDRKELVFLGMQDITGKRTYFDEIRGEFPFTCLESLEFLDTLTVDQIHALNISNAEGYVLYYENGFREKVKFSEYVDKHRSMTYTSTKTVWKYLYENTKTLTDFLKPIPDELYPWIHNCIAQLNKQHNKLMLELDEFFERAINKGYYMFSTPKRTPDQRKAAAMYITNNCPEHLKALAFIKFSKGDDAAGTHAWKMLRPEYELAHASNYEPTDLILHKEDVEETQIPPVLLFTKGLPASGKSTWANAFVHNRGGWVNVCRDDVRKMLGAGKMFKFDRKIEKIVTRSCINTITAALLNGFNVVLSDTNLNPKTVNHIINDIRKFNTIKFVVMERVFYDVSLEECLRRNKLREDQDVVPEESIYRMYNKYLKI